eukprot:2813003-Rhodomonas_salina.1
MIQAERLGLVELIGIAFRGSGILAVLTAGGEVNDTLSRAVGWNSSVIVGSFAMLYGSLRHTPPNKNEKILAPAGGMLSSLGGHCPAQGAVIRCIRSFI